MRGFKNILLLSTALLLASCNRPPEIIKLTGQAQGTSWSISFWTDKPVAAQQLQLAIENEFSRIDQLMSTYRDDSVISQFNQQHSLQPVTVGEELVQLVEHARLISQATAGCYDLTVQPLFELWGFKANQFNQPEVTEINQTLSSTGLQHVTSRGSDTLTKAISTLQIDVSSIAQGYSVERLAAMMQQYGVVNYLVEIGGELITNGHKPDNTPWRIAIERPLPGAQTLYKVLQMTTEQQAAVMTSGTYRHYFSADGKRFSHIIDGRTGWPVQHNTVSVTVVHSNATLADAWSTALLCVGRAQGLALAEEHQLAVLFIDEHNGDLQQHSSALWQKSDLFTEAQ